MKFIHLPFSLCAGTFIFSVLLQGAAQLSVIHSYISTKDFWIAVAILLSVYFALIAFFLVTDSRSGRSNLKLYKLWVEERGEKENGRGDEQQIVA